MRRNCAFSTFVVILFLSLPGPTKGQWSQSGNEVWTTDAKDRVGIGTDMNINAKFHVTASDSDFVCDTIAILEQDSNCSGDILQFGERGSAPYGIIDRDGKLGLGISSNVPSRLYVETDDEGHPAAILKKGGSDNNHVLEWDDGSGGVGVIDEKGKLGVNTMNPNGRFDVDGKATIGGHDNQDKYNFARYSSSFPYAHIDAGETNQGVPAGIKFHHRNSNGSKVEAVRIEEDGNVGIGTPPGSYLLNVDGDAFKPTGEHWSTTSDRRLKDDIEDLDEGLSLLRKVRPVRYHFKDAMHWSEDKERIGVLAQEVREVLPNSVDTKEMILNEEEASNFSGPVEPYREDTTKGQLYKAEVLTYNSSALKYLLVNSVKELDSTDSTLEKENQRLKERLSKVEEELESLKDRFPAEDEAGSSTSDESVKNVELSGDGSDKEVENVVLQQNRPNPFRESTTIEYSVPGTVERAEFVVHDQEGRRIESTVIGSGNGRINVFASDLEAGAYTYTILIDGERVTEPKRMVRTD